MKNNNQILIIGVAIFVAVLSAFFVYSSISSQENISNSVALQETSNSLEIDNKSNVPQESADDAIHLICEGNKSLKLEYVQVYSSPGPGQISIPHVGTLISLVFSDGTKSDYLKQGNSQSEGQMFEPFVNEDSTLVFKIHKSADETSGTTASVLKNGVAIYSRCTQVVE